MLRVDYFPLSITMSDTLCCVGRGVLGGVALTNTSDSAPSNVILYDGADTNGRQIALFALAPGQTLTGALSHDGVRFTHGIYVATGGGVEGSIFAALDALQPVLPRD